MNRETFQIRESRRANTSGIFGCSSRGDEAQINEILETPSAFARLRRDKHAVSYGFPFRVIRVFRGFNKRRPSCA